jgi:DNA polymerase
MDPKAPLAKCSVCPLRDRPVVRPDCTTGADLVVVGEAPGRREVVEGRAFVGKSGRRLDEALAAAGVERRDVYVTNVVLCHPEANQSPPPDGAVDACHDRLIREVSQMRPKKVMALGKTAAEKLTGDRRPIKQLRLLRPPPSPYLGGDAQVRVTYHPSALPRDPEWPGWFDADIAWLGEP